jgi:hypothetical protein
MMTRKDYVATAEILSDWADVMDYTTLYALAKDFADYFAQDNERFNRNRFYSAVGIEN